MLNCPVRKRNPIDDDLLPSVRNKPQADQLQFISAEWNVLPKLFLSSTGLWNANREPVARP